MVKKLYGLVSVLFFISCIVILSIIDKTNNIELSLTIQILLILYCIRITWGCVLYIKSQFKKNKYSYKIIMNLGLVLFLIVNILRHINLFIIDRNLVDINDIYYNTLNSFSYFAYLILPLIIIITFYSIFTNIVLIIKEGFKVQNLLGILFGIFIILGALTSQFIYDIINYFDIFNSIIYVTLFIKIGLNSILCYFYCLTLATLYCNVKAANHKPDYNKDFVIILGSRIKEDGTLTPLLKARVDKALEFAKEQEKNSGKKIIFVPSGGKGRDEIIAESEAMKNYLVDNGIKPSDIIIENESTSTVQNLKLSKNIIDDINSDGKIIFSTTNYHVFRSGVIANNEGIDCEGIGSKTKWYFYTNALIREFFANLISQRRQHLALISIINLIIFILVLIGFKYGLV